MDGQSNFNGCSESVRTHIQRIVYYLLLLEYGIPISKLNQDINEWLVRCACVMLCMCLMTNRTPSSQSLLNIYGTSFSNMENGKPRAACVCSTKMIDGVKKRSNFFSNLCTFLQLFCESQFIVTKRSTKWYISSGCTTTYMRQVKWDKPLR
jgi:hypothetical protein